MIDPKEAPTGYKATACIGPLENACCGCAFYPKHMRDACLTAKCTKKQRIDGEHVIFVEDK